jgi:hypothetical protein
MSGKRLYQEHLLGEAEPHLQRVRPDLLPVLAACVVDEVL